MSQLLLRAPDRGDAIAVAELLAGRDKEAFGRSSGTFESLLAEWDSAEFALPRDAIVAEAAEGALAGYAVAHPFGTFAAVDRSREGQGIGSALLDWCEQRQRELGWKEHRTSIPAGNLRAKALLVERGYDLVRSNWRMTSLLDQRMAEEAPPRGVTLRALDPRADADALYDLDQTAFAAVAGTTPMSLAAFVEQHLGARDLDPSLSRMAECGGEPVGFVLTQRREAESAAYVDILAVHPREQGRGIGRALLLGAFAASRRAGLTEAQLGVSGDNPRALRLYEGVGMRARAQLDVYGRSVGGE